MTNKTTDTDSDTKKTKARIYGVHIKLNKNELAYIEHRAKVYQCPRATYARQKILDKEIPTTKYPLPTLKFLAQIARIGNNLNQIARAVNVANVNGVFTQLELAHTNVALQEIYNQLVILQSHIVKPKEPPTPPQKQDFSDGGNEPMPTATAPDYYTETDFDITAILERMGK